MNITALIVTFNRLEKLKLCWRATSEVAFSHIVIVDNASGDGTADWLSSLADSRLTVLRLAENIGGAGGFKFGAEHIAARLDTEWVALFDDDAYPPAGLIDQFSAIADRQWEAYCCRVVDRDNRPCRMNVPFTTLPRTAVADLQDLLGQPAVAENDRTVRDVSSFSFVGAIIKQQRLAATTPFIYPELFIYFDDLYYSYRLKLAGCRIRYTPEITFIHDIPAAGKGSQPAWKVYYLVRNLVLGRSLFKKNSPFSLGAIAIRIIKYLLSTVCQKDKKHYLGYVLRGIYDGFAQNMGRRH